MKIILVSLLSVLFQTAFASELPTTVSLDLSLSQCQQTVGSQDQGEVSPAVAAAMIEFVKANGLQSPVTFYAKFENLPGSNQCASHYNMTLETWSCDEVKASCVVRCEVQHVLDNSFCWP